ncbi:hypothetical protein [Methylobacterium nonmethylotrophicum]|uniref:Uncharacterized protein n=1 Tax=Methylobacterium nonmethylotrophicum TaxID=1141884 RepID=A0A4Z0NH24_9HYPH|nr:hypothetical protein [Methylobacterium nonmethylotrophicum]TGD94862.1 hypothetical protein EU555_30900 [Methylobacterium nonmethylotrophicum]
MSGNDALMKALADVSERRAALEAEYERIGAELAKLRLAENALRAIIEDTPIEDLGLSSPPAPAGPAGPDRGEPRTGGGRRGPRGPRANSTKGRLKALIDGAGPQGLSQPQILRALPDAAPATINAYLSAMVTAGEALLVGNFYTKARTRDDEADGPEDDGDAVEGEADDPADGDGPARTADGRTA